MDTGTLLVLNVGERQGTRIQQREGDEDDRHWLSSSQGNQWNIAQICGGFGLRFESMEKVRLGWRKSRRDSPIWSRTTQEEPNHAHLLRQRNYPTEHAAHNP